jgi:F0F1-type ATP synthase membrane subunit b/b'
MTDEERKAKLAKLEKDLAAVKKLATGLLEDAKKETDVIRKEDLEAQSILVARQVESIESEIAEMKNAPKDSPKRLRSIFGRR